MMNTNVVLIAIPSGVALAVISAVAIYLRRRNGKKDEEK